MVLIRAICLFALLYCVSSQRQSKTSPKYVPPRCRAGHYYVPPVAVPSSASRSICKDYGGRLAAVDNSNFDDVTSLLFNCSGPQKKAWIRAWDNLNYNLNCLALYIGTSGPGGSIDTSCSTKKLPSLCADPRKAVLPDADLTEKIGDKIDDIDLISSSEEPASSLATDESEQQKSFVGEDDYDLDDRDWVLDVENSMFIYKLKQDII